MMHNHSQYRVLVHLFNGARGHQTEAPWAGKAGGGVYAYIYRYGEFWGITNSYIVATGA